MFSKIVFGWLVDGVVFAINVIDGEAHGERLLVFREAFSGMCSSPVTRLPFSAHHVFASGQRQQVSQLRCIGKKSTAQNQTGVFPEIQYLDRFDFVVVGFDCRGGGFPE